MAPTSTRKKKRQRADDSSSDQTSSKKHKSKPANFPPDFYDKLSKVRLTSRALRELDRRNDERPPPKTKPTAEAVKPRAAKLAARRKLGLTEVAQFAAAGGPDLSDLKGYPEPTSTAHAMASPSLPSNYDDASTVSSSSSRPTRPTRTKPTTAKSKHTSAYDVNFEQHCIDYRIYPSTYRPPGGTPLPQPANLDEILTAIEAQRDSLSPSVVPETAYEEFELTNSSESESKYMRLVFPLIAGNADILYEEDTWFNNITSITENAIINPTPDLFDGAHPDTVDKQVRTDLNNMIVPSNKSACPIAPNFFLEAKSREGSIRVAERQAVLDGSYGAYIMHALQNYLTDGEPEYDGNAYAFSAALIGGYLELYAHHIAAPAKAGGRPTYYTTLITAYALIHKRTYPVGRSAFRNLRMRAKEIRDRFIANANERARRRRRDDGFADENGIFDTVEGEQRFEGQDQIDGQDQASEKDQVGGQDQVDGQDQVNGQDQVQGQDQVDGQDAANEKDQIDGQDHVEAEEQNKGSSPLEFYDAKSSAESDGEQETQQTIVANAGLGILYDTDNIEASPGFAASFASSFTSISHEDHRRPGQAKKPRSPPSPSTNRQHKRRGQAEPAE